MNKKAVSAVVVFAAGYAVNGFLATYVIKKKEEHIRQLEDYSQNLLNVIDAFVPHVPESVQDAAQEKFAFQVIADNFGRE